MPLQNALQEKYADKVVAMRPFSMKNEDGTVSTVKMQSLEVDGRHYAVPTIFPPSKQSNDPDDWLKLDGMAAFEEAMERGEVFEFQSSEEANSFAEGSWKTKLNKPKGKLSSMVNSYLQR